MAKRKRESSKLTVRERKFIDAYLSGGNATQAHIDAGYRAKSRPAHGTAAGHLLKIHKIENAIAARRDELARKSEVTRERVLAELAKIAFDTPIDVLTYRDKLGALKEINQMQGFIIEHVEHSGEVTLKQAFTIGGKRIEF